MRTFGDPRVCLVTGASSGIGQATAPELLRAGHIVYGGARRLPQMATIREAGGHPLPMDVTREDDLLGRIAEAMARAAEARPGHENLGAES
ncbi:SDR family NAD(P)-dependent oxidoreductase [Nonomuraea sp. NPDC050404]|uniref:SDR family NAD(P)-dependent oxidoreductase n=1 Tax=Nonomuraea sp. NPDC050404 TaxID=3155783 RepID=UPI0033E15CE5